MNKKRKIDDVLESIFTLIQDAHSELKKSEKNNEIPNNLTVDLTVERKKSITLYLPAIGTAAIERIIVRSRSSCSSFPDIIKPNASVLTLARSF